MRIKCISCEALARLVYWNAARSPHIVDIELMRLGWHNDPDDLRERLQAAIDAAEQADTPYDAIVLAYGLCGKATHNLKARAIPLIIPRAHDCITMFLGSRSRYQREFTDNPGTYWYVRDYVERADGNVSLSLGAEMGADAEAQYADFVQKYGKDNADYLMEVMGAWQEHYNRAAYIEMGVVDSPDIEAKTRDEADKRGWTFEKMAGDAVLIRKLLMGEWPDVDFMTVQPGSQIAMSYDERVVGCVLAEK